MDNIKQFKNILIIGAGGGIGQAFTQLFLTQGKQVIASVREPEAKKHASLRRLQQSHRDQLSLYTMDITQQESIEQCFSSIASVTDRLHLILNCSGLLHSASVQPEKRLEEANQTQLFESFAVNSIGPLLIARYALPLLRHDEISILATLSARVGSISDNRLGGWYGYRASKAAQNMITKTVAIELKRRSPSSICVGLHPGTVDTGLSKPFQSGVSATQLKTPDESVAHLSKVLDQLQPHDSGKVFAWDGIEIPA